eukprot:2267581-Heterocapsa_arctica.AAC.1
MSIFFCKASSFLECFGMPVAQLPEGCFHALGCGPWAEAAFAARKMCDGALRKQTLHDERVFQLSWQPQPGQPQSGAIALVLPYPNTGT